MPRGHQLWPPLRRIMVLRETPIIAGVVQGHVSNIDNSPLGICQVNLDHAVFTDQAVKDEGAFLTAV